MLGALAYRKNRNSLAGNSIKKSVRWRTYPCCCKYTTSYSFFFIKRSQSFDRFIIPSPCFRRRSSDVQSFIGHWWSLGDLINEIALLCVRATGWALLIDLTAFYGVSKTMGLRDSPPERYTSGGDVRHSCRWSAHDKAAPRVYFGRTTWPREAFLADKSDRLMRTPSPVEAKSCCRDTRMITFGFPKLASTSENSLMSFYRLLEWQIGLHRAQKVLIGDCVKPFLSSWPTDVGGSADGFEPEKKITQMRGWNGYI